MLAWTHVRAGNLPCGRGLPPSPPPTSRPRSPTWERAKAAVVAGDTDGAVRLIDRGVAQWRSLQDYSINWVTSLLSFIGRELGEEAVERALRQFGEEFVQARRGDDWDDLPAATRARAVARAMVANFGTCAVEEDDEKITLSFHCGSGGRLIDEGRYDGDDAYLTLQEPAPRTFMRDELPVYCAHCSVNNEISPSNGATRPPRSRCRRPSPVSRACDRP